MGYLLDILTALAGAVVAIAVVVVVSYFQDWDAQHMLLGILYSCTILSRITGTSAGVLRLFSRFRQIALQNVLASFFRLIGVFAAYLADSELPGFLFAWGAADIAGRIYLVCAGQLELSRAGIRNIVGADLVRFSDRFAGFWSFIWSTNLHSSMKILTKEADILLIAAMLGNSSVALYKIVKTIGTTMAKLTEPLYQAVYPSMANLVAKGKIKELQRLTFKPLLPALFVSFSGLLTFILLGQKFIVLVFGVPFLDSFGPASIYLLGTCLSMATFTFHPAMLAFGKASLSLRILTVSNVVYLLIMAPLILTLDLAGAATAYVVFYFVWSCAQFYHIKKIISGATV
jgi:O-antigen/teichoic acid export membrane protein